MKKIISVLLLFVFFLTSCNHVEYFEKTGWNATEENFRTDYYYAYIAKTEELKVLHNIEWYVEDEFFPKGYYIYLYDDHFTITIKFLEDGGLGFYCIDLYYYGDSNASREDFEKQRPLVNFINDFTNYVAFDTKTDKNHFEALYNSIGSYQKDSNDINYNIFDRSASYYYHYDSAIGNVGYSVALNIDKGYYYKMQENDDYVAICNRYHFEGLLKPIDIS